MSPFVLFDSNDGKEDLLILLKLLSTVTGRTYRLFQDECRSPSLRPFFSRDPVQFTRNCVLIVLLTTRSSSQFYVRGAYPNLTRRRRLLVTKGIHPYNRDTFESVRQDKGRTFRFVLYPAGWLSLGWDWGGPTLWVYFGGNHRPYTTSVTSPFHGLLSTT